MTVPNGPLGRRTFLTSAAALAGGVLLGRSLTGNAVALTSSCDPALSPSGFATDGSAEVTADLNAWFATVPDGSTVDLTGMTFWCDQPIRLVARQNLTVKGGTLTRKGHGGLAWPDPNPHWWLQACPGFTMTGFRVLGANTVPDQKDGFGAYKQDWEFEAAVRADGCVNLTLDADLIDAVWGDGYQLQPYQGVVCDQFRLTGHIDRIGRQGVTPLGTNGYVSCAVDHGRRSLFDLEPATAKWPCHDITLEGCSGNAIGFPIAAGGRGPVDNITIKDCHFGDGSLIYVNASDGARRKNWTVTGNTWGKFGSPVAPARFSRVDGVVFENNAGNIVAAQSRKSLYLEDCPTASIRGNSFGAGLYVDNVTPPAGQQLTVSGNTPVQTVR